MIDYQAPVSPVALTTFVRTIPQPIGNVFATMFARRDFGDNKVDLSTITRTNQAAKYRALDGALAPIKRPASSDARVSLLPLGGFLSEGEYERVQREFSRTGGTNQAAKEAAIYNDAEELAISVYNRLELARGELLSTGALNINENGVVTGVLDFGVPAGNKVSPTVAWTDTANAKPLSDMLTWYQAYLANGVGAPRQAVTSNRVVTLLLRNAEIVNAVAGAQTGRTMVTLAELNALLATWNLPPVTMQGYDNQIEVDGVNTRVFPDDKFVWLPENTAGMLFDAWGTTATAMELVDSQHTTFTAAEAPGLVGVVDKSPAPPYRRFTYIDGAAMPILSNERALFIADVA